MVFLFMDGVLKLWLYEYRLDSDQGSIREEGHYQIPLPTTTTKEPGIIQSLGLRTLFSQIRPND